MKTTRILALALVMALLIPTALAAPGDTQLFADYSKYSMGIVSSIAQLDGKLLILSGGTVYAYQPGDAEPQEYITSLHGTMSPDAPSVSISTLLAGEDGTLYGLDSYQGFLVSITSEGGKAVFSNVVQLDLDDFMEHHDDYSYLKGEIMGGVLMGGKLYCGYRDWEIGNQITLYAFDIKTGEKTVFKTQFINDIIAYKDGKLLVTLVDENNIWDSNTGKYKPVPLCEFDPATDTTKEVAKLTGDYYSRTGYVYDAAADTLYFAIPNQVMRMVHLGEPELCAYHPASNMYSRQIGNSAAIVAGKYALITDTGVYVRGTDPAQLPAQVLTISKGWQSDNDKRAVAAMGGTAVLFKSDTYYSSAQQLGEALVSGEADVDIFSVQLDSIDLQRLMEKGYCYDLSGNAALNAAVSDMFPLLQEAVQSGGKLYAIPAEAGTYGVVSYPNNFKAVEMEPPTTLLELCELISTWNDEYIDEHSNYRPTDNYNHKESMMSQAFEMYANYLTATGQPLQLDTPLFRKVMTAVSEMRTDDLDIKVNWDDSASVDEVSELVWQKKHLISTGYGYQIQTYAFPEDEYYHEPLLLSLDDGMEPYQPLSVQVYFINPRSKNIEAAMQYLEAYCAAMDEEMLAMMSFNHTDPIESPYYEENLKNYDTNLAALKKQLEAATDPASIQSLEEALKYYEEDYLKDMERNRYTATTESIAAYHEVMKHAFVQKPSVLYMSGSEEFTTLFRRFFQGQIPLDQFIREGDAKLRMMQMEE